MRLTYTTSTAEATEAQLAYAATVPLIKRAKRYGLWILSIAGFVFLSSYGIPHIEGHVVVDGETHHYQSAVVSGLARLPISFLLGWLTWLFLQSFARRYVIAQCEKPRFGRYDAERWVEATDDWLITHYPLVESRHAWSRVKELRTLPKFVFLIAEGNHLLAMLPTRIFHSPEAQLEFEQYCRRRMTESRSSASSTTP